MHGALTGEPCNSSPALNPYKTPGRLHLAAGEVNWGGELEEEVPGGVVSAMTTSAGTCACMACLLLSRAPV